MAENSQNRRYPPNLQGVLRLAVEAASAAEGPAPLEPMSEERKTWLREALAEVCKGQMDEVEQMKRCLAILLKEEVSKSEREGEEERDDEEDEDERESALETLSEFCENLDNARDLMTLGGLELCLSQYLFHVQSGLRWRAAQVIASCAQNMPQVQVYLLSIGALPKLLQLTDSDPNPTVRVKALYAASCLVREQEVGLQAFLSLDGFSVLMRGMQSENEKLSTKSAFLLLNLLTSHPEQKDTVVSMGMVQQLVSVLRTPHSSFHEQVLGALCCRGLVFVLQAWRLTALEASDIIGRCDVIVEVCHPQIVKEFGLHFLSQCHFMVGSPSALSDPDLNERLRQAAQQYGRTLYIPSGALWGGQDIQRLNDSGTLKALFIRMSKHPSCFRLTGDVLSDWAEGEGRRVLFRGSVAELCPLAPNNVNTMAAAAVAAGALGFTGVQGEIVSDTALSDYHVVEVEVTGLNGFSVHTLAKVTGAEFTCAEAGEDSGGKPATRGSTEKFRYK
ncbi:hypothetical protein F2P81_014856 [Scophthalmus maximus]|uniref:Aspartate dehydrogenase domain-containing protein n=1 Tax=Scophthalmus maximus TaxID=52904 RepID=A0A6A4SBL3_SCOMX|nr:hypothetical protein F2P81_014856 [Scophthalmus maximus]